MKSCSLWNSQIALDFVFSPCGSKVSARSGDRSQNTYSCYI